MLILSVTALLDSWVPFVDQMTTLCIISFLFADSDACVTPVLTADEAARDAHNQARRVYFENDGDIEPSVLIPCHCNYLLMTYAQTLPRFSRARLLC